LLAKKGAKLIGIQRDINPFSLMEEFLLIRQAEGITKFTVTSYRSALRNFLAVYRGSIKDGNKLRQAVNIFLADKKSGYYNKLLQALRQFFQYLIGEGILKTNPCDNLRYKREGSRIIQYDEKVIKALLSMPDTSTFAGLRDYVFMLVMLDVGIRPNELLQITLRDIDFMNSQMIVREQYSKTRQLRTLPLSPQTINTIKKLISARHEEWNEDTPVFCSFSGHRLTSHNLQEKFRWYGEKLGTHITPYALRHCFALMFIRNGGNVFALQKIMGHSRLEMTQVYVNLIAADIKNSHSKASPINTLFASKNVVTKIKK
jgi:site-specific recombinase XerD